MIRRGQEVTCYGDRAESFDMFHVLCFCMVCLLVSIRHGYGIPPDSPVSTFLFRTLIFFSRRMALVLSCWLFCIMASVRADVKNGSGSMKGSFTHSG